MAVNRGGAFMFKLFKAVLSLFIIIALQLQSIAWAQPSELYLAPDAVREKTSAYSETLLDLSSQIESRFYDIDGLAEHLDYDVQAAADYAINAIAYVPYLGVMRGPAGTLSTQSGSSWDQAVFLAALINAMGGEAILGLGALSDADAMRLLALGVTNEVKVPDGAAGIDIAGTLKAKFGIDPLLRPMPEGGATFADYDTAAPKIAKALAAQLAAAGKAIPDPNVAAANKHAKALGKNYVWVRYRDTPNDPWTDVHPAFGAAEAPDVTATQYIADTVPENQLHKVGVQFQVERLENGKFKTVAITQPYERPSASLSAAQIRVGIAPNTAGTADRPTLYTAIIDGRVPDGSLSFSELGLTASTDDALSGPEIFTTVSNRMGGALGTLGAASGDDDAAPRLTGVLLRVTYTAPGGQKTTEMRRLADFREEKPDSYSRKLVFNGVLEVNVGAENGARDMKALLEAAALQVRQLPYNIALAKGEISAEDYVAHPAFAELPTHAWLNALALSDVFNPISAEGRLVRMSPLVMMYRASPCDGSGLKVDVDIQYNQMRGFRMADNGSVLEDPALALQQGINDTLVEGELIGVSNIAPWTKQETLRVVGSETELKANPLWAKADGNTQDRLKADLKTAGLLLLPQDHDDRWWRFDPSTGTSLGMSVLGGSETVEEMTLLDAFALGVTIGDFIAGMVSGAPACAKAGDGVSFGVCCIAGVTLLNTGLMLVGGGIGEKVTTRFTAAIGAIAGLTFDVAGLTVPSIGNAVNKTATGVCDYAVGG